jgi:putative FmdB family regulatory protein
MTYCYRCPGCGHEFDVIKSVRDMDVNEFCPRCEEPSERQFVPKHVFLSNTQVTHAEYNPGLGTVVKNKRHKEYLMKSKGVVEVGNDYGSASKMQDSFDRAREEKLKKSWDDV